MSVYKRYVLPLLHSYVLNYAASQRHFRHCDGYYTQTAVCRATEARTRLAAYGEFREASRQDEADNNQARKGSKMG